MAPPYQVTDWYGGRHTCHTASGATANSSVFSCRLKDASEDNDVRDAGKLTQVWTDVLVTSLVAG